MEALDQLTERQRKVYDFIHNQIGLPKYHVLKAFVRWKGQFL